MTSCALRGAEAVPIQVEVDLLRRLPGITIVGLAASEVKESAERIRSAIQSADLEFPRKRVVVNLAPADLRKDGTSFDLPVAIALLAADGQVPTDRLSSLLLVGELALGGEVRPVRGMLCAALLARQLGRTLVLPAGALEQASLVEDLPVAAFRTMSEVVAWLRGTGSPAPRLDRPASQPDPRDLPDLEDVVGQPVARRALEVAAAGGHHLLFMGPPGCGKTMLARRLPSILPPMTAHEALDATRIHSAAGIDTAGLARTRPFRAPHHSVTAAGMVGDARLRPGEISLAHHGVLFLDEAAEFHRSVIQMLRQPLEEGRVTLTRAAGAVSWPAAFTLVLASNCCPCGRRGGPIPCDCPDTLVDRYLNRLSGPILDRIDLHVALQPVETADVLRGDRGEASATVRERVVSAREMQWKRQGCENARLSPPRLRKVARLEPDANDLLCRGAVRLHLSARATTRVLKVARTLADLAGSQPIGVEQVAEALAFRPVVGA